MVDGFRVARTIVGNKIITGRENKNKYYASLDNKHYEKSQYEVNMFITTRQ